MNILDFYITICEIWYNVKSLKGRIAARIADELPRDKTNKMIYAPSEDSDQPGHPPSLIRVFAVCSMGR